MRPPLLPSLILVALHGALSTTFPHSLEAQSEPAAIPLLLPGDAHLDTRRIVPRRDTLVLLLRRDGEVRTLSTLVREVARRDGDGTPVLRIIQEYNSSTGTSVDTSVVLDGSLEPLWYAAAVNGEIHRIRFESTRITGTVTPRDSTARVVDLPLDRPTFNGITDREVIEAISLGAGYRAEFPVYNPPRTTGMVRIEVTGSEQVPTAGGPVDTWVVDYRASTGAPSVVWMDKATGRFVRRRVSLPNGGEWWMVRQRDISAWAADLPG